ncbi:MAG: hypothetical protein EPO65_05475 [Dehalococcoidia bacterium]|nr:MAG: hypothetical protein EPO65_05475 [Dehalococcoidia bacterium]
MAEGTRVRQAFERYWRLGAQRSLRLLHDALTAEASSPTLRTLEEWSRRYHWQDRIADLERQARHADDSARIAAIREMAERHAKEGLLLQQKGAEWLTTLGAEAVTADAAIRAVVEGVKLERLARGDVTERTESRAAPDPRLDRLTDDEFDRLLGLAEGVVEGGGAARPDEPA